VADDYKILKLRPHCVHQEAIIEQVAAALPPGVELVVKEHPMSIGRNPVGMLRRLSRASHIHLLDPRQSSLELAKTAAGVATISSSVGLEALLCNRSVLTLATPFYAGYGVTLDLEDLREISEKVPELLEFKPDPERTRRFLHAAMRRCWPGVPVLVDSSDENARVLAATLDRAAAGERARAATKVSA
jgi:capsule polysaccharide modification protein KpsS